MCLAQGKSSTWLLDIYIPSEPKPSSSPKHCEESSGWQNHPRHSPILPQTLSGFSLYLSLSFLCVISMMFVRARLLLSHHWLIMRLLSTVGCSINVWGMNVHGRGPNPFPRTSSLKLFSLLLVCLRVYWFVFLSLHPSPSLFKLLQWCFLCLWTPPPTQDFQKTGFQA